MRATVTAFIPSYNNADTLQQAIDSVKLQTSAFDELLVLDDSSLDGSAEIAAVSGARVIRHAANLGRGAMRARGVLEASGDLILSCDSTSVLRDDFSRKDCHGLPMTESLRYVVLSGDRWEHLQPSDGAIVICSSSKKLRTTRNRGGGIR